MDGEKWPAFRLRWMLPIYLVLGALWTVAVAIDIALGGLTSPLHWLQVVLVALVVIVGTITEWRHRRDVASSRQGGLEPDNTDSSSPRG
jgi:hypothetical protein